MSQLWSYFGKSQNLFNYRAECCRGITAKSQIFGKEIKHFIKINATRLTGVLFLSCKDVKSLIVYLPIWRVTWIKLGRLEEEQLIVELTLPGKLIWW